MGKKELHLKVEKLLRETEVVPKLTVAVCIIKNDKMADMISMVVQLGVTEIVPIISEYVTHRNFNHERFQRIAQESSEQCERLDVPSIHEPIALEDYVNSCKSKLIYAYENSSPENKLSFLKGEDVVCIIGPEGGFSDKDVAILNDAGAIAVTLGKNILRAETAAVKMVSCVLLLKGM